MSEEMWRDIPNRPFYQASSEGRIRSLTRDVHNYSKKGRIRKFGFNPRNGYLHICYKQGENSDLVHRVIALVFLGDAKPGSVVNHKNGIKTDNRSENLEWCSQRENCIHFFRTSSRSSSKLTTEDVKAIRDARKSSGDSFAKIGIKFGVSGQMVGQIVRGQKWAYV